MIKQYKLRNIISEDLYQSNPTESMAKIAMHIEGKKIHGKYYEFIQYVNIIGMDETYVLLREK